MRIGRQWLVAVLLLTPAALRAQTAAEVPQIPVDTLRDIAMTRIENGRPVVYYNPELLRRVGPDLALFFMTHEYGHIASGHSGAALAEPLLSGNTLRLRQEFEADCYAAHVLAPEHRAAVDAAIEFFLHMGNGRHDAVHPTGSQRAAQLLACLAPD